MVLGGLWHGAAWTFVLWGAFHGAGARASSTRSRGRFAMPAWLRWFVTFHLVVFGWILFRSQRPGARRRRSSSRSSPPGPATLWTPPVRARDRRRDRPAARARGAASRTAQSCASRRLQPGRARRRAGGRHRCRRRDRAQPGRAPVHLLPLLMSHARRPTRRQPDGPLRPQRPAPLPRARRDPRRSLAAAVVLVARRRARRSATAGEEMNARARAQRRARGRQARRLARRPAAARRARTRDLTAGCRPTRSLGDRRRRLQRPGRRARRRLGPAGHPDAFDPGRDRPAAPPPRRTLRTLLVTGDSMSMPLDADLARRLAAPRASRSSATRTSAPAISKTDLVDWGKLSARRSRKHQPRRGRGVHRRQRGLPDGRAARAPGPVLRRATGRRSTPTACG